MLGSTVDLDLAMRAWGFEDDSRREAEALEGEMAEQMQAYVAGVNAALAQYPPVEYGILGIEPEPWTVADSFSVGYMIAWGITHNWRQELSRFILAWEGGWERAEAIYPSTAWPGPPALKRSDPERPLFAAVAPELKAMLQAKKPGSGPTALMPERSSRPLLADFTGASNGWVLSGERSVSNKPLVASDPHLPHMLPSIVYQQHLLCGDLDVIGATVPGLPYVLMGHNRHVAWAMTSAVADVIDLYVERMSPGQPARVDGPDGPEALEIRRLVIRVRDGDEMEERVFNLRQTPRGPVLNDMMPGILPADAPMLSIQSGSLGAGQSIRALQRANRAKSVVELQQHMMAMPSPINTVLAGDVHGQIALFATGTVPIRRGHRGTFPAPAWDGLYQWGGFVAPEAMPYSFDTAEGYYAHGNTLMWDPKRSPYVFQVDSAPSYRRDRIVDLIKALPKHDHHSTAKMQLDVKVHRAMRLLPGMLKDLEGGKTRDMRERRALKLLKDWDYEASADSAAAAIFFATYREIMRAAMLDEASGKGLAYLMSQRYFPNAVDLWFDQVDHPVWDHRLTPEVETRPQVLRVAFRRALRWLAERLGDDPQKWRWGELHRLEPRHLFGGKIGAFNLEGFEAGGGLDSVWKSHFDMGHPERPFKANYGPVYRMVVDLADPAHAWWVVDTGVSGWPQAPHYVDQAGAWRQGRLLPMQQNIDEIKGGALLRLNP